MMTLAAFAEVVKRDIKEYLPKEFDTAIVEIQRVTKNNGVIRTGITVRQENQAVAPNVYLEEVYEELKNETCTMPEALTRLGRTIEQEQVPREAFGLSDISDFDTVKDQITFRLVNAKANRELIKNTPHKMVEDLAVVYQIEVTGLDDMHGSVRIGQELMERWGISEEQLDSIAMENTIQLKAPSFISMNSTISKMFGNENSCEDLFQNEEAFYLEPKDRMYVLSNQEKHFGASILLYPNVMEKVGEAIGEDFYILPSSVHEVLVLPKESSISPKELGETVRDVNETQVSPEEVLSDRVYEFNRDEKGFHQIPESLPKQKEMVR